jgi:hypothetical protein
VPISVYTNHKFTNPLAVEGVCAFMVLTVKQQVGTVPFIAAVQTGPTTPG